MNTAIRPNISNIHRTVGLAGRYAYNVTVAYPGEATAVITFVGSVYGGPIVMTSHAFPAGIVVADADRFGPELSTNWVRNFYA